MGELKTLVYDGKDFLETKKVQDLYAKVKFWGEEDESPIYLKFQNGRKPENESAATTYRYSVNCLEKKFERYIDDMGSLNVDLFSLQDGLTIGTSKVPLRLYLKRHKKPGDRAPLVEMSGAVPVTLIGDKNSVIGEYTVSVTTEFAPS